MTAKKDKSQKTNTPAKPDAPAKRGPKPAAKKPEPAVEPAKMPSNAPDPPTAAWPSCSSSTSIQPMKA
jgi:hypothetical protein